MDFLAKGTILHCSTALAPAKHPVVMLIRLNFNAKAGDQPIWRGCKPTGKSDVELWTWGFERCESVQKDLETCELWMVLSPPLLRDCWPHSCHSKANAGHKRFQFHYQSYPHPFSMICSEYIAKTPSTRNYSDHVTHNDRIIWSWCLRFRYQYRIFIHKSAQLIARYHKISKKVFFEAILILIGTNFWTCCKAAATHASTVTQKIKGPAKQKTFGCALDIMTPTQSRQNTLKFSRIIPKQS